MLLCPWYLYFSDCFEGRKRKANGFYLLSFVFFKTTRSYVVRGDDKSQILTPTLTPPHTHTTQTCKLSKEIIHRTINRFRKAFILSIMQENIKKRLHNEIPTVLAWKRTTCKPMKVSKCILMANDILWKYWCKSQFPRVCDIRTLQQFQNEQARATVWLEGELEDLLYFYFILKVN